MFKMFTFTRYFYARLEPLVERQYCCINWALRQVSPDRLQNGLHIRSDGRIWRVTLVRIEYYTHT